MSTEGIQERHQLARMIKAARVATRMPDGRRMPQDHLARAIGYSQGNLQKYEAGTLKIPPAVVDRVVGVLGIDADTAETMRRLAAFNATGAPYSREPAKTPKYAERYLTSEPDATEILSWHELRIPGPLQSEQFMFKLFTHNVDVDVATHLRTREARKQLFRRPTLQRYDCVIAEVALLHFRGPFGDHVVRDEIDYLLALNDPDARTDLSDERTTVRLLPADQDRIVDLQGDFSVLRVPKPNPDLVYVEHVLGATYKKSPQDVATATAVWRQLADAALDRAETNDALRKLRRYLASG